MESAVQVFAGTVSLGGDVIRAGGGGTLGESAAIETTPQAGSN